jgi:hypothetical protein
MDMPALHRLYQMVCSAARLRDVLVMKDLREGRHGRRMQQAKRAAVSASHGTLLLHAHRPVHARRCGPAGTAPPHGRAEAT